MKSEQERELLFRQPDCAFSFHAKRNRLQGGENATGLFGTREYHHPYRNNSRQEIYCRKPLRRQERFQENYLRSRFQTGTCGKRSIRINTQE